MRNFKSLDKSYRKSCNRMQFGSHFSAPPLITIANLNYDEVFEDLDLDEEEYYEEDEMPEEEVEISYFASSTSSTSSTHWINTDPTLPY